MYAVINHLHLSKLTDQIADAIRQEGLGVLSALPGFLDFYFVKHSDSDGTVIILWDTPAHAQSGAQSFGPTWFAQNIAVYLTRDQERSTGEVVAKYEA